MKSDLSTDTIIKQKSALMLQQIQSHAREMGHKIKKKDSKQISRQELYQIKT